MSETASPTKAPAVPLGPHLCSLCNKPHIDFNPADVLGKLMDSEMGEAIAEKSENFEKYVRAALKDIYTTVDRLDQKANLISGNIMSLKAH